MTSSPTPVSLSRVDSVEDFYQQLSDQLFDGTRSIRNADALADLLQEAQVHKVVVDQWNVPLDTALVLFRIFADLGISLQLQSS